MKDLRIIIVAWNVEQLLEPALRSLSVACGSLSWDVVVVDNASTDKSVEIATRWKSELPQLKLIINLDNRGFAKACNQGLTELDARYALLLNPDTECPAGSLEALIHQADKHKQAGVIGPKLLNSDGLVQTSIRRFPTFWSQLGIMLKFHNLFPGLFRRYFASDLSLDTEQDVDQVMGSCFLIRRELLEQIGGLDERYFVWFEEVDFCRMAHERGWTVRYLPSVQIMHHGGHSFGQVFSLRKQRYFNTSLVTYFKKWQPGWRPALLRAAQPLSLAFAWVVGRLGLGGRGSRQVLSAQKESASWKGWAMTVVALETVSALTIFNPFWNTVAVVIAGLIVLVIAYRRPTLALSALLMELMIGSKGYLLQFGGWPSSLSLRIIIFVAFLLGWGANVIRHGSWRTLPYLFRERIEYLLLFIVVGYATLRGMSLGNGPAMSDANAWAFLVLIVPVLDLAKRYASQLRRDVLPVLFVAPVWLAIKTIGLEYIFSHGIKSLSQPAYLWVRRSGVGEVTLVVANAFRIFMQSYVFALPAFFFGTAWYFTTHAKGSLGLMRKPRSGDPALREGRGATTGFGVGIADLLVLSSFVILAISLSRSMWIGAAAGFLTIVGLTWAGRPGGSPVQIARGVGRLAIVGVVALLVIFSTLAFPVPHVDVASLKTLFGSRLSTEDAAAASRWKLLSVVWNKIEEHPILGSGFGATVTYQSSDPRIVAQTGGTYTTYAFEWGWLEHWVKFGLFGFVLMLWIVYRLGYRIIKSSESRWLIAGGIATLVGLAVTHIFTPYLNHPLGFTLLFLGEGWIALGPTVDNTEKIV